MQIAARLRSHVVMLSADLLPGNPDNEHDGLAPGWVKKLAEPIIEHNMDLAIPRFIYHYYDNLPESHLAYQLMTSVFANRIRQPITGDYGISYKLVTNCLKDLLHWTADTGQYGVDPWLTISAVTGEANVCEVNMGLKRHIPNPGKLEMVFRHVAGAFLEQIVGRQLMRGLQAVPALGGTEVDRQYRLPAAALLRLRVIVLVRQIMTQRRKQKGAKLTALSIHISQRLLFKKARKEALRQILCLRGVVAKAANVPVEWRPVDGA